jgi:hypothetical protein
MRRLLSRRKHQAGQDHFADGNKMINIDSQPLGTVKTTLPLLAIPYTP